MRMVKSAVNLTKRFGGVRRMKSLARFGGKWVSIKRKGLPVGRPF